MSSITLITAFFNLNKMENRPSDKSNKNYLIWAELLFKLKENIVFFIEEDNYDHIFNGRKKYNLLNKTQIIIKKFKDLQWYNLRGELTQYMDEHPIKNTSSRDSTNFFLLTWNKMYFIEDVIKKNPFNTTHFGWIDFGINHVAFNDIPSNIDNMFNNIIDKIKILELRWISNKELSNISEYTSYFRYKIAGGLFTGNSDYMLQFINYFKKFLYELLSKRIVVNEESIYEMIYKLYPELFEPFFGDYQQILINYAKISKFVNLIAWNIDFSRKNGDYNHALSICNKVYDDMYDKLSPTDKFKLNDEIIINSFYVGKNKSEEYVKRWIEEVEKNNDQIPFLIDNKDRIIANLSYYENSEKLIKRMLDIIDK